MFPYALISSSRIFPRQQQNQDLPTTRFNGKFPCPVYYMILMHMHWERPAGNVSLDILSPNDQIQMRMSIG